MPSEYEQAVYTVVADAWLHEDIITDACAQAIAAWWHSPGSPNSTALSTMGVVMCDTQLSDFATDKEYAQTDANNRMCLNALSQYIQHMKSIDDVKHVNDCECGNAKIELLETELVEIEFSEKEKYTIYMNF